MAKNGSRGAAGARMARFGTPEFSSCISEASVHSLLPHAEFIQVLVVPRIPAPGRVVERDEGSIRRKRPDIEQEPLRPIQEVAELS